MTRFDGAARFAFENEVPAGSAADELPDDGGETGVCCKLGGVAGPPVDGRVLGNSN